MLVVVPLIRHRLVVLSHHDWLGDNLVRFPHRALVLVMRVPTLLMVHSESFLRRQHLVDGVSFLVEHAGLAHGCHAVFLPPPGSSSTSLRRLVLRQDNLLKLSHNAALIFRGIDQYGM